MVKEEKTCREWLAYIWAEDDCWGDYTDYHRCMDLLRHFDREQAIHLLKHLVRKYRVQADEWAYLCGGTYLQSIQSYEAAESIRLMTDLHHIAMHIPAYALLREGKNKEAEAMAEWMENSQLHTTYRKRQAN